ncbi:hypothetical protein LX32DRAFT_658160 [Colletotrichum zoysiae]|uniref:Uncharacterized protein n=1 Tax=Colletotrichum zoysiae TaxID=1216348 RepID=A0AAD9H5S5_9PEZI|nr:hypothetical protein LX32DRAFT_658160 [Colletotrichum zoysiae]
MSDMRWLWKYGWSPVRISGGDPSMGHDRDVPNRSLSTVLESNGDHTLIKGNPYRTWNGVACAADKFDCQMCKDGGVYLRKVLKAVPMGIKLMSEVEEFRRQMKAYRSAGGDPLQTPGIGKTVFAEVAFCSFSTAWQVTLGHYYLADWLCEGLGSAANGLEAKHPIVPRLVKLSAESNHVGRRVEEIEVARFSRGSVGLMIRDSHQAVGEDFQLSLIASALGAYTREKSNGILLYRRALRKCPEWDYVAHLSDR